MASDPEDSTLACRHCGGALSPFPREEILHARGFDCARCGEETWIEFLPAPDPTAVGPVCDTRLFEVVAAWRSGAPTPAEVARVRTLDHTLGALGAKDAWERVLGTKEWVIAVLHRGLAIELRNEARRRGLRVRVRPQETGLDFVHGPGGWQGPPPRE